VYAVSLTKLSQSASGNWLVMLGDNARILSSVNLRLRGAVLSVLISGVSDKGVRAVNEDRFVAEPALGLAVVADGVGGRVAGGYASELLCRTLINSRYRNQSLAEGISRGHADILEESRADPLKQGMSSTVVAVAFDHYDYQLVWVGDSRAYLWDGQLKRLTRDHNYLESLLDAGDFSEEELLDHPEGHLITQAVGARNVDALRIDQLCGRLGQGQKLLLCSDGLSDELSEMAIASILCQAETDQQALDYLLSQALKAGGRDNITAVLVSAQSAAGEGLSPSPISTTDIAGKTIKHRNRE
jgi:protein phosphatase